MLGRKGAGDGSGNVEKGEGGILGNDKHWKDQRRYEEGGNIGEKELFIGLVLFRNEISLHVLYQFVEPELRRREKGDDDDDDVEGSVSWLARLHAWPESIVSFFTERKTRGRYCRELYWYT